MSRLLGGGQMLFVVPEQDLLVVLTGWNILEQPPKVWTSAMLERVLRAVAKE